MQAAWCHPLKTVLGSVRCAQSGPVQAASRAAAGPQSLGTMSGSRPLLIHSSSRNLLMRVWRLHQRPCVTPLEMLPHVQTLNSREHLRQQGQPA